MSYWILCETRYKITSRRKKYASVCSRPTFLLTFYDPQKTSQSCTNSNEEMFLQQIFSQWEVSILNSFSKTHFSVKWPLAKVNKSLLCTEMFKMVGSLTCTSVFVLKGPIFFFVGQTLSGPTAQVFERAEKPMEARSFSSVHCIVMRQFSKFEEVACFPLSLVYTFCSTHFVYKVTITKDPIILKNYKTSKGGSLWNFIWKWVVDTTESHSHILDITKKLLPI